MTRHPSTEGNELRPEDVLIPDPAGPGRVSLKAAVGEDLQASVVVFDDEEPDSESVVWVDTSDGDTAKVWSPDAGEWQPLAEDVSEVGKSELVRSGIVKDEGFSSGVSTRIGASDSFDVFVSMYDANDEVANIAFDLDAKKQYMTTIGFEEEDSYEEISYKVFEL